MSSLTKIGGSSLTRTGAVTSATIAEDKRRAEQEKAAAATSTVTMKEPTVTTPSAPSGMNVFQNYEASIEPAVVAPIGAAIQVGRTYNNPRANTHRQEMRDYQVSQLQEQKAEAEGMRDTYANLYGSHTTNAKEKADALEQRERFDNIAKDLQTRIDQWRGYSAPSDLERVGKTLSGTGKSWLSGHLAGVGTVLDAADQADKKMDRRFAQQEIDAIEAELPELRRMIEAATDPAEKAKLEQVLADAEATLERDYAILNDNSMSYGENVRNKADELMYSAAQDLERAKVDAGTVGRFAVDAGAVLGQQVLDYASTLGVAPMVSMMGRVFGNSANNARAKGYDIGQQAALGVAAAATEYFSERLFGGNPLTDTKPGLVNQIVGKVAGDSRLLRALSSAPAEKVYEGLEELVSGVLNPAAELAITGNADWPTIEELINDGLVGVVTAIVAGTGQDVINVATGRGASPGVKLDGDGTSQGMVNTATAGTETVAEDDNPIRVGRVTTIRNPYEGPTPVYVAPPNRKTPIVSKKSVNNATNNIANAHAEELATGRNFRSVLAKAYETIFPEKKKRIDIGVDGLKMDGEKYVVSLYKGVVGKVISDKDISAEKLAVFDKIEEIVRSAEYVGSAKYIQKGDKRKHTVRFDYFETPTTIGGKDYVVSFDVEVFPASNNYRTHRVINEMDIVPVSRADTGTRLPQGLTGQRPSNNTVAEPTPIVKQENVAGDGLGAADAGFTTPTRGEMVDTQDKTTTKSRYMSDEEKARFAPEQHERLTAEMSAERAAQYFYNDSEGNIINLEDTVETLLNADVWDAAQQDAAQVARGLLIKKARDSGDWGLFGKLSKAIQNQGTMVAQSLQARKKWVAQSAENIVTEAAAILEKAKKLLPNGDVMKQVSDMAYRYEDAASTDDAAALADIIRETAKIRKTTALMGKSDHLSKTAEWALNRAVKNGDIEFLKTFAANGVVNIASDKVNPSVGNALKTVRRNAMLSKISTTLRNFVSNNIFDPVDSVSRDISVPLDMLLSKFTKTRSVAVDKSWFSKAKREGAMDGLAKSLLEVGLDVDASGSVSRYEGTAQRTFSMNADGKVWGTASKVFSTWEKYNGYALTTTDEAQKGGIEREVQRGIDKLYERGLIADESLRNAGETEAKYRTFQDETKLSKTVTGARRALNNIGVKDFGAGDLFLPFAQVPANLATRSLEYSPVGLASSTAELVSVLSKAKAGTLTAAEQAHAVQSFGRAVNGTAMIAASVWLAANGLIRVMDTGKDDEDKDMLAMMKMSGQNGTQLNLTAAQRALRGESAEWQSGDTLMSIGFLEPMNAFLTTGALIAEDIKDAEQVDAFSVAKRSVEGTFQSVLDLPVLENIRQISNQYQYSDADTKGGKAMDAVAGYVAGQAASFVPNAVKGIAQGLDTTQRDLYTSETVGGKTKDAVVASLPGLRENAPAKIDSYGREMTTGDPLLNFLNSNILPGTLTEYSPDATMPMLDEVYQATGDAGIFPDRSAPNSFQFDGAKVELTTEEKRQYLQDSGSAYREYLLAIEQDEGFDALSNAAKAEVMRDAKALADEIAKSNVLAGREAEEKLSKTASMKRDLDSKEAAQYLAYKKAFDDVFGNSAKPTSDFISVLEQVSETTNNSDVLKLMGEADGFKKWDAANKAGVSTKDYLAMYNAAEGKTKQWQQFDGIVKASAGSDADKLAVMKIYTTTEKSAERLQTAYDDGFTLAQIVAFKQLESEYSKKSDQKEQYRQYGFSYNEWKKLYDIFN